MWPRGTVGSNVYDRSALGGMVYWCIGLFRSEDGVCTSPRLGPRSTTAVVHRICAAAGICNSPMRSICMRCTFRWAATWIQSLTVGSSNLKWDWMCSIGAELATLVATRKCYDLSLRYLGPCRLFSCSRTSKTEGATARMMRLSVRSSPILHSQTRRTLVAGSGS